MGLQLKNVFASVRVRRRKIDRQALVNGLAFCVAKRQVSGLPWRQAATTKRLYQRGDTLYMTVSTLVGIDEGAPTTTPIAFLLTELVELAMMLAPQATMRISVQLEPDRDDRARLTVRSTGLCSSDDMASHLDERYGRVLTGLSRQLRTPLEYDGEAGSYSIVITVIP